MKKPIEAKKIVVALDQEDPKLAMRLVEELSDQIECFKLGPVLFTRSGPSLVDFLHRSKKKIFLDLKLYDTPRVVSDTVKQYGDLGVHYATVHTLGGKTMLEAASSSCRGYPLNLLGVTLMTSQNAPESRGISQDSELSTVLRLADLAMECRLSGVLCSPHELSSLRARVMPTFSLVSAGIRITGEEVFHDDQKRTSTAREAVDAGADLLIVGRPLTQPPEPLNALRKLLQ